MLFSDSFWGCQTPTEDTWDCFSRINTNVPIVRIYLHSDIWLFLMGENFFPVMHQVYNETQNR